jgi:uncharacterized protein
VTGALAIAGLGLVAGVVSGLFGVGGGIIFVPALTLVLGRHQLQAEATSLAAIVPVAIAGSWRQHREGLVRWNTAMIIGITSVAGVLAGAEIATSLSNKALERTFGVFLVAIAIQLALKARGTRTPPAAEPD